MEGWERGWSEGSGEAVKDDDLGKGHSHLLTFRSPRILSKRLSGGRGGWLSGFRDSFGSMRVGPSLVIRGGSPSMPVDSPANGAVCSSSACPKGRCLYRRREGFPVGENITFCFSWLHIYFSISSYLFIFLL